MTIAIVIVVVLASVLPCRGRASDALGVATKIAIALLFFFHGARLSRRAVLDGLTHYRLHLLVLCSTFVLFPLLGLLTRPLWAGLLSQPLHAGVLFLCVVPSTVQSSIAFTALARGNVAAAVCSASASSLLGIVLTPLLVQLFGLTGSAHAMRPGAVLDIVLQLLLPFVAGQLAQGALAAWVSRHRAGLRLLDQGSILLVVYTAFSAAVVRGLWRTLPARELLALLLVTSLLLALALLVTWRASRLLGFTREDEIAIVFCGSKKSLASGVPLANVLFPVATVGVTVLPLMLFHQIQLMVCAALAQRYASRGERAPGSATVDEQGRASATGASSRER